MGMMRDLFKLTREAQELKKNNPTPSMGEMVRQATDMVSELNEQQAGRSELLLTGLPGKAIVKGMGTPERGAQWFNLVLDLEVHPTTRDPYRVANDFLVPASAQLGVGVELPVRIDPNDASRIAIDWEGVAKGPTLGEIRPV